MLQLAGCFIGEVELPRGLGCICFFYLFVCLDWEEGGRGRGREREEGHVCYAASRAAERGDSNRLYFIVDNNNDNNDIIISFANLGYVSYCFSCFLSGERVMEWRKVRVHSIHAVQQMDDGGGIFLGGGAVLQEVTHSGA